MGIQELREFNIRLRVQINAIRLVLGSCLNCGSKFKLQFAHIKPTNVGGLGRGQRVRFLDILRHPDSYTYLCKVCHKAFDNGDKTIYHQPIIEFL